MVRPPGTGAQLIARRKGRYALLRLPSGEMRKVLAECYATVGQVGNLDHENKPRSARPGATAGCGWRPTVRGVVMNPVDHPHGGGEGRTSGGRHPVTPWGVPTKGKKTRNNPRTDKYIVRRRGKSQSSGGREHGTLDIQGTVRRSSPAQEDRRHEQAKNDKKVIKTWSRRSTVTPDMVGTPSPCTTARSSSRSIVTENMVGHKLGEFSPTRTFKGHAAKGRHGRGRSGGIDR